MNTETDNQKKKGDNYIFGDLWGGMMQKTSQKFQFEAAMMSLTFLILGIAAMGIYVTFFAHGFTLYFKIITAVNAFFGVILLYSQLVGLFQQYKQFNEIMSVQDIVKELSQSIPELPSQNLDIMKGGVEDVKK